MTSCGSCAARCTPSSKTSATKRPTSCAGSSTSWPSCPSPPSRLLSQRASLPPEEGLEASRNRRGGSLRALLRPALGRRQGGQGRAAPSDPPAEGHGRVASERLSRAAQQARIGRQAGRGERVIARLVIWNLADSKTTIEELRRYLRDESVDLFEEVEGLRFKAWISDEAPDRWGAIYLWESEEAARQVVPSRARELIGKDPDVGEEFDVEATIEGRFDIEELSRLGLAFETGPPSPRPGKVPARAVRGRASRGRPRRRRNARDGTRTGRTRSLRS